MCRLTDRLSSLRMWRRLLLAASLTISAAPSVYAQSAIAGVVRDGSGAVLPGVTIEDPNVYTRPWTVAIPLNRDPSYQMFEYACHEGNKAVEHVLSAARAAEKRAADVGKKQ